MSATVAPDDIVRTHAAAAANDREPLLVLEPLREFLAGSELEAPGDLGAWPIGDGHSNVTFALSTGVVLPLTGRAPSSSTRNEAPSLRRTAALQQIWPFSASAQTAERTDTALP